MGAIADRKFSPGKFNELVIVGKDVLELLSSAMYVDPLTIYREYIQNAADAIDEAESEGLCADSSRPRIAISTQASAGSEFSTTVLVFRRILLPEGSPH